VRALHHAEGGHGEDGLVDFGFINHASPKCSSERPDLLLVEGRGCTEDCLDGKGVERPILWRHVPLLQEGRRRGPQRSEDTRRLAERSEALDQLEPDSTVR
jgi:hypothetical protein